MQMQGMCEGSRSTSVLKIERVQPWNKLPREDGVIRGLHGLIERPWLKKIRWGAMEEDP